MFRCAIACAGGCCCAFACMPSHSVALHRAPSDWQSVIPEHVHSAWLQPCIKRAACAVRSGKLPLPTVCELAKHSLFLETSSMLVGTGLKCKSHSNCSDLLICQAGVATSCCLDAEAANDGSMEALANEDCCRPE
eukprot:7148819-Alexandrium_andersonii.AAC.1